MSTREIGYALDPAGGYADPRTAPRREHYYRCFDCGEHLHVRRGTVRRPYFAHYAERPVPCSAETIAHEAAKHRLVGMLLVGDLAQIALGISCPGFVNVYGHEQSCPDNAVVERTLTAPAFDDARVEAPLGPYFIDAAALRDREVVLALEVYHSHRVEEVKRRFLSQHSLPWCEVRASDVLETEPPWTVVTSSLGSTRCDACDERQSRDWQEREARRRAEEERIAAERERTDYEARAVHVARDGIRVVTASGWRDGHLFTCLVCEKPVVVTTTRQGRVFMHQLGISCDARRAWVRAGMLLMYNQLNHDPKAVKVLRHCSGYGCNHWFRDPLPDFDRAVGEEPNLVLYREGQPVLLLGFDRQDRSSGSIPFMSLRPGKLLRDPTTLLQPKDGRLCDSCKAKTVKMSLEASALSGTSLTRGIQAPARISRDEPWARQTREQVAWGVAVAISYFQALGVDVKRVAQYGIIVRKCEHCTQYGAFINTLQLGAIPKDLNNVLTYHPVKGMQSPGFLRNRCSHCAKTINNRHDLFASQGEAVYLEETDLR